MTTTKSAPYHHGDLRRALIDAALTLIATEGGSALTLRKVAQLAGVTHAAPYRHFADKAALLAAVAEEGFLAMSRKMQAACAPVGTEPLARFQALGVAYVQFAISHPGHFRIMFGPDLADRSPYRSLCTAADSTFGLLVTAIADCQAAGLVSEGEPRTVASVAWSTVHGLASLLLDGQLMPPPLTEAAVTPLAQYVVHSLYDGLAKRSA